MSMQMMINDACDRAAEGRGYPIYEGHDDYDDRPDPSPAPEVVQVTPLVIPDWLKAGLGQYIGLASAEYGIIDSRDPDEDFGHLAATARADETGSTFEVFSDALYLPEEAKIGTAALRGNAYVVQTSFSLGLGSGDKADAKPSLTLDLLQLGADGRDAIARAAEGKSAGVPRLGEGDLLDASGNLNSLVRVNSRIRKPKSVPSIGKTEVGVRMTGGEWLEPSKVGKAAGGLLKAVMSPVLSESITRVRIEAPTS
ncbi:MAG: hypothetical protein AAB436_03165 [Patescibacteria group bacterium]